MGNNARVGHQRVNPGFWVFWFIPPLLTGLSPANLLCGGDFQSLHTWSRCDFSSIHGRQSESWRLECVGFWKLNRTYPGEKQPLLSVPTKGWFLASSKPTLHLLAILTIPVGIRALYEDQMACSVKPAQELLHHLSQDF